MKTKPPRRPRAHLQTGLGLRFPLMELKLFPFLLCHPAPPEGLHSGHRCNFKSPSLSQGCTLRLQTLPAQLPAGWTRDARIYQLRVLPHHEHNTHARSCCFQFPGNHRLGAGAGKESLGGKAAPVEFSMCCLGRSHHRNAGWGHSSHHSMGSLPLCFPFDLQLLKES